MENSAITVFLTLQCFFVTSQCQNLEKVKEIEEVIAKNTFYPPLNGSELLKPLVFGLIMSFGGNLDSSGAIPGVRVALDRINKDSTLLPGYSLHYALSDSRVMLVLCYIILNRSQIK